MDNVTKLREEIGELKRLLDAATDPDERADLREEILSLGLSFVIGNILEEEQPPESARASQMIMNSDSLEELSPAPSSHPGIPCGNKDKRLVASMPNPYAEACEKAEKEGRLDQHLRQVADELSGFDS